MGAYRLRKDSVLVADAKAGTVVYDLRGYDYGLASDDTRITGIKHKSVTLKTNGGYPSFTVPEADLEKIDDPARTP